MASTFAEFCIEVVMGNEGGLQTDTAAEAVGDPGGITNYGFTTDTLRALGLDISPADLTREQALELYQRYYWAVPHGPALVSTVSPALALALLDASVQHGLGNAARLLQSAVKAKPDGVIGPKTLEAIETVGEGTAVVMFHSKRREFVVRWVAKSPKRVALVVGLVGRVDFMERQSITELVEGRPTSPLGTVFGYASGL